MHGGDAAPVAALPARRRTLWAFAAGLAGGLTTASKYTAAIVLAAPAWAGIEIAWRRRRLAVLVALGAACAAGALVGFSAGCPQCVLRPDLMYAPLARHYGRVSFLPASAGANYIEPSLGWYARPGLYQLVATFPWALGWPLYQQGVAQWIGRAFAARIARGDLPRIEYPREWQNYVRIGVALRLAKVAARPAPATQWLATRPDVFILPDWVAMQMRRDRIRFDAIEKLDALQGGRAGYRRVAAFRSRYLHQELYTAIDPAFAADLWQGETGFTVYVREDLLADPEVRRGVAAATADPVVGARDPTDGAAS